MKLIIRVLATLLVFCTAIEVQAHQPNLSTTLLVEQGDGKWILQVRSALTAFEYEIEKHFGASAYNSPEEFQGLVTDFVQNNIAIIKVNDENAAILQNGMVKLGHETTVTFEVIGMPKDIQSLVVKNSSFRDISRNQSALIVVKEGFSKNQFMLDNDNEHTVELQVVNSEFKLVTATKTMPQNFKVIAVFIGLVLILVYFIFKKNRMEKYNFIASNS